MPSFLNYRRHRFDALHALLTGAAMSVGPNLRRDVGLPEALETRAPQVFDPTPGVARRRD